MEKTNNKIEIISYHPDYKHKYKELNYEWLNKYFKIEKQDELILSNPEQEILAKNGHIFFAVVENQAIGTCTIVRKNENNFELSKMCVTPKYQHKGIGEKLLDEVISYAIQQGAVKISLLTNEKLKAAMNLYKKKGFRESIRSLITQKNGFIRESTCMCLELITINK